VVPQIRERRTKKNENEIEYDEIKERNVAENSKKSMREELLQV
jgi:hypothetical protein